MPLKNQDGIASMDSLPKQVELVVIYPCRLIPADSDIAKEYKWKDKVIVSREDAFEAIGNKRAVLAKEFDDKKYPEPLNKKREKKEKELPKPPAK